jgi:Asp-tRNA(Asn)/Glu-tRNA(Gln) amidotransferase A subunit family amidase
MAAAALRAQGHRIDAVDSPVDPAAVVADHRRVMAAEAFAAHGRMLDLPVGRVGPRFLALLAEGAALAPSELRAARARLALARDAMWAALADFDAVLAEPVPDVAPVGLDNTGPTARLIPWTVFGGPLVVVPAGLDGSGMPLSVMIAAAPGHDAEALAIAARLADEIDLLPECAPAFAQIVEART